MRRAIYTSWSGAAPWPCRHTPRSHTSLRSSTKGRSGRLLVLAGSRATVHFSMQRQVGFGESHKIVGSAAELGDWNVDSAPHMSWSEGDVWTLDMDVPVGRELEFKCVKVAGDHAEWEQGSNRLVQIPNGATNTVRIGFEWSRDDSLSVEAQGGDAGVQQQDAGLEQPAAAISQEREEKEPEQDVEVDDRLPHQRWQGREATFMRSNEHSKDRQGIWNTKGLEGAARTIVSGDEEAASWLGKMQLVKKVLVDDAGKLPDIDALATTYIYLQLISTGAIECKEGGGHYRPNKHAELARDIFRCLERAIGEPKAEAVLKLVARKAQTKLPSFTGEYTQSTPLTRIRDIAHRNDIPHELKQEIKHTIQNKLHRNAGPEDLVATEAMLKRVSSDGSYSQDFVNEFRVFTGELRDFFNAGSFADMLQAIKPALDEAGLQAVDRFVESKRQVDKLQDSKNGLSRVIDALHSLTSLRALLLDKLSSGIRNDAPEESIAMRQRFRLGEIRGEDYAFVLLSRFLNLLDEQGGAEDLSEGPDSKWALPIGAAVLGIRHIGLGGWATQECMALENELGAWQQAGEFDQQESALRLKATLERAQRLTQGFTDALLEVFPQRATALGSALGLADNSVQVFTEAEVRASLVFQLSKLCSLLLKASRLATGGAAWDALVAGEAAGKLVEVDAIEAGALEENPDGSVILLVKQASGDEEVGALGVNLKGVILCHGLPHLSHLGVRARQERVVFVACEDESTLDDTVRSLIGQEVLLTASLEGVTLVPASQAQPSGQAPTLAAQDKQGQAAPKATASKTNKVRKATVLPLEKAEKESCGSKSASCAELARLSADGSFSTASGVCFPFGNMEAAIKEAGKSQEFEALVAEVETAEAKGGALDAACDSLQALVASLRPADSVLAEAGKAFDDGATLIVRSSANVEDLAGMSGAGLYDSLPNVPASDSSALGSALAGVWASLYTRRAVLSRRAAGVPQKEACMAVLIQEQLAPEISFVLHTVSPLDHDEDTLYAELAAGLGETLASGTRGSPWRLSVHKSSGNVRTLAFANFSKALVKAAKGRKGEAPAYGPVHLDYSKQALSTDKDKRAALGKQLAAVGAELEKAFGGAQDVEGAVVGSKIFIVQTRPQP